MHIPIIIHIPVDINPKITGESPNKITLR